MMDVKVKSTFGFTDATLVNSTKVIKVLPIFRSGPVLLELTHQVIPFQETYQLGVFRNTKNLQPEMYLNTSPKAFSLDDHVLIIETVVATGGKVMFAIEELLRRGLAPSNIRIISIAVNSSALRKLSDAYSAVVMYTATIDEKLDCMGFIEPGLGHTEYRAYGTVIGVKDG